MSLLCAMRREGWGLAPVYSEPKPAEIASCLEECEAGNGASCERVARTLGSLYDSPSDHRACVAAFKNRACSLGLPSACAETSCGEGLPSQDEALAHLSDLCTPGEASWACFYLVHSRRMVWGRSTGDKAKTSLQQICSGRCPKAPERCYRQMACEALHPKR